ncbi:MAG TPA: histidine phosphatase family protein [Acidimicrobiales bacterium]|nr:histidine phosphatase family protein [Acidimicrobiales bacterium]
MLIIVRHGRTEANARGLLLGHLDPDLDPEGEAQAAAAAAWLGPVARVVSSPLVRARRTAEAFGVDVELDERWVELDYGSLDGTPVADVPAETWAAWRADADFAPPGGESHAQLRRRVVAAATELLDDAARSDVVVVTHVSPIKAVLGWVLDVPEAAAWRTRVGQPSISRIGVGAQGPVLVSFNECPPGSVAGPGLLP